MSQERGNGTQTGAAPASVHSSEHTPSFKRNKDAYAAHKNSSRSFELVNQRALISLPLILVRWLPGGRMRGREYIVKNPRRADTRAGSFSVNVKTGKWADFATGDKGGDAVSLCAYLFDLKQIEALEAVAQLLGLP